MSTLVSDLPLSASEHNAQLRKAIIASTIGTAIEWYDFFLYGTAAGLIFGKLYFPNEDPLTATLAAFGTYFIGFVGRPIGAAIFGHYGDRIGRKATLIATLLCMGIATFLIAFVPTYAEIGIWGAVILTVLRMIQGIGVGGEWGGSVLLAMEWSRTHHERGLIASWPQFGVPAGLFLANLAVLAFSAIAGDQFATWGWRIPFAISPTTPDGISRPNMTLDGLAKKTRRRFAISATSAIAYVMRSTECLSQISNFDCGNLGAKLDAATTRGSRRGRQA